MDTTQPPSQTITNLSPGTMTNKPVPRGIVRLARYATVRLLTLSIMVIISVFLTTIVANMGGYVDEIVRADTTFALGMAMRNDEYARSLTPEERAQYLEERVEAVLNAQGMNQPFLLRTARWVTRALTLNWGESKMQRIQFAGRFTRAVNAYVLDRLPRTLLLFGLANLLLFGISIVIALALTHTQGSWMDRLIIVLSLFSSAPPWVYGIILTVLTFQIPALRFVTARFDAWPTEFKWAYVPLILQHMLLPVVSILLSKFFQSVFAWRAFFLIHYNEDYVDLAKAKGVPLRMLERRYILRPTLPSVLTSFALLLISLWQEVIILEHFFNVAGIGKLFVQALAIFDTPLILGIVVTFAYLLAATVFIVDIACALVDPRVRIGSDAQLKAKAPRRKSLRITRPRLSWQLPDFRTLPHTAHELARTILHTGRQLLRFPSAVLGLSIIIFLIGVALYAIIAIPYQEAIVLWRSDQITWYRIPRNAEPVWFSLFTRDSLPPTLIFDSRTDSSIARQITQISPEITDLTLVIPFEYTYDRFPQELSVYLYAPRVKRSPHVSLSWQTPDGRIIRLGELTAQTETAYRFSYDDRLLRRLGGIEPEIALFADPTAATPTPLKGRYELHVNGLIFEEPVELEAELIVYGQVYGLAGTDGRRRDLMVAVLWGAVAALAFGLLAAVGTTLSTMLLGAMGAWFGGWLDELLQRVTEVNMVLPFLPVSLMIFTLYSKSFWVLLGVIVLLSIFGSALKNYRAIFLQTKQSPYIEAARSYGASDWRIIFKYLIPRVAPVLIPQLVVLVPSYVFLESALAFLGLSDPVLPTWGKLAHAAFSTGVFVGPYHLVLVPTIALVITGLGFALVAYALEQILNPQLQLKETL